jgi:hypothetical protein
MPLKDAPDAQGVTFAVHTCLSHPPFNAQRSATSLGGFLCAS